MNKTIIFMSGICVPQWLAQSKFIWDSNLWKNYNCIWLNSKIPYSDSMVGRELDQLENLVQKYDEVILAGHSLGAWWISNLICRDSVNVEKTILFTPLTDTSQYPIFNATPRYHPCNQLPNINNIGLHKILIAYGNEDLIVSQTRHAFNLVMHFKAMPVRLEGGHFYQTNHKASLMYIKDWVES
jgi:pimeloyl-ACP methyl ester carboxylesterase